MNTVSNPNNTITEPAAFLTQDRLDSAVSYLSNELRFAVERAEGHRTAAALMAGPEVLEARSPFASDEEEISALNQAVEAHMIERGQMSEMCEAMFWQTIDLADKAVEAEAHVLQLEGTLAQAASFVDMARTRLLALGITIETGELTGEPLISLDIDVLANALGA